MQKVFIFLLVFIITTQPLYAQGPGRRQPPPRSNVDALTNENLARTQGYINGARAIQTLPDPSGNYPPGSPYAYQSLPSQYYGNVGPGYAYSVDPPLSCGNNVYTCPYCHQQYQGDHYCNQQLPYTTPNGQQYYGRPHYARDTFVGFFAASAGAVLGAGAGYLIFEGVKAGIHAISNAGKNKKDKAQTASTPVVGIPAGQQLSYQIVPPVAIQNTQPHVVQLVEKKIQNNLPVSLRFHVVRNGQELEPVTIPRNTEIKVALSPNDLLFGDVYVYAAPNATERSWVTIPYISLSYDTGYAFNTN